MKKKMYANHIQCPEKMNLLHFVTGCTVLMFALLLSGCRSHRTLAESSSRRDSVRIETAVRTEYVPDTVFIEIPMEGERVTVRDTASHLETSYAVSDARLNTDGSLYHSLRNKPQKRPFEIKTEVVYRDSIVYRDRTEAETRTVEVERGLTRWQRIQMRGFWIAITILVVYVFRKPLKNLIRRFI